MLRSIAWLIPVALGLVSFGSNVQSALAQTTGNLSSFDIDYKTAVDIRQMTSQPGFVRATITGTSTTDAPFGLNSFISNTYGRLEPSTDPSIIKYTFNSDPKAFGLPDDLEVFSDRYFGGADELSGKASDRAEINLAAGTIEGGGTITIFDGTGIFKNATGTISFTQQDKLGAPGVPTTDGLAKLNFKMQTARSIPEPTPSITLVGIGLVGGSLLLRRRKCELLRK